MRQYVWPELYNSDELNSVEIGDKILCGYKKCIEQWKERSQRRKRKDGHDHPEVQDW
jgi:hypothetical protein